MPSMPVSQAAPQPLAAASAVPISQAAPQAAANQSFMRSSESFSLSQAAPQPLAAPNSLAISVSAPQPMTTANQTLAQHALPPSNVQAQQMLSGAQPAIASGEGAADWYRRYSQGFAPQAQPQGQPQAQPQSASLSNIPSMASPLQQDTPSADGASEWYRKYNQNSERRSQALSMMSQAQRNAEAEIAAAQSLAQSKEQKLDSRAGLQNSITGPHFPFALVCVAAPGAAVDVNTLPVEARSIGIREDVDTQVGKTLQVDLFLGIFADRPALAWISRIHCDFCPAADSPGKFTVNCRSPNGIRVNEKYVGKGEAAKVRPPVLIDFLTTLDAGKTFDLLCRWQFEPSHRIPWGCSGFAGGVQPQGPPPPLGEVPLPQGVQDTVAPPHVQSVAPTYAEPPAVAPACAVPPAVAPAYAGPPAVAPTYAVPPAVVPQSVGASNAPYGVGERIEAVYQNDGRWYGAVFESMQSDGSFVIAWDDGAQFDRVKLPGQVRRPNIQAERPSQPEIIQPNAATVPMSRGMSMEEMNMMQTAMQQQAEMVPGMQSAVGEVSACPFWLELGGSALREDYPPARRKLIGQHSGIVVGRTHQGHIFLEAFRDEIRDELLKFISRDHFRIVRCPDSTYRLERLTGNSMWRVRPGERVPLRKGCDPLPLAGGDIILLYSGATDNTPDGPGNLGTLFFNFCDAQESAVTMGTRDALVATGGSCLSGFGDMPVSPHCFPQGPPSPHMQHAPHQFEQVAMPHGGPPSPHMQHTPHQLEQGVMPHGGHVVECADWPSGFQGAMFSSQLPTGQPPPHPHQDSYQHEHMAAQQGGRSTPPAACFAGNQLGTGTFLPGSQLGTGMILPHTVPNTNSDLAHDNGADFRTPLATRENGFHGPPMAVYEPGMPMYDGPASMSTPPISPRGGQMIAPGTPPRGLVAPGTPPRGRRNTIEDGVQPDSMRLQMSHASAYDAFGYGQNQPPDPYPDPYSYGNMPPNQPPESRQPRNSFGVGTLTPFGLDEWRTVDSNDELTQTGRPMSPPVSMRSLPGTDHFKKSGFQYH